MPASSLALLRRLRRGLESLCGRRALRARLGHLLAATGCDARSFCPNVAIESLFHKSPKKKIRHKSSGLHPFSESERSQSLAATAAAALVLAAVIPA